MTQGGAKFCMGWVGSYHTCTIRHTYLFGCPPPLLPVVKGPTPSSCSVYTTPAFSSWSFGHWTANKYVNPWYAHKSHIAPCTWLYSWHVKNKLGCQPYSALYIGKEKRLYMSCLIKRTQVLAVLSQQYFSCALRYAVSFSKGDRRFCI